MTPADAATLLVKVAALNPNQRLHDATPAVWAEVLPDVTLEDALAALNAAARVEDFITPAAILRHVPRRPALVSEYRYHDE